MDGGGRLPRSGRPLRAGVGGRRPAARDRSAGRLPAAHPLRGTALPPIPVFEPTTGIDTAKAVVDALAVGWLGMGRLTEQFETAISEFLGLEDREVVAVNTGTSALHIALRLAGVGEGDEVVTTSFNYVADHQAIRMCGAEPVMADIRDDNLGMDVRSAGRLVGPRTKALLPLHFAGAASDLDGIHALAAERGLRVVEDACHAFGTLHGGRRIGSFGDIACFSFDPVKIVTSLDGGCVVVPDAESRDRLRLLRFLGVDKETHLRYRNARAWEYDVVSEGYRYHLNSVSAAVGVSQMARVEEFIASRQATCALYNEAFAGLPWCRPAVASFEGVSPFVYSLRVLDGARPAFLDHMGKKEVGTGIHFVPVHRHTHFAGCPRDELPVTERVCEEVVTLPLHSTMPSGTVARVVDAVTSFAP